jgi:hypothetical protein
MLVSAIALTVVCAASFAVIPVLWWMPRNARTEAASGHVRRLDHQKVSVAFTPQSGRSDKRAA